MNFIRRASTIRFLSTQRGIETNSDKLYKNKIDTTKPPEWDKSLPFEDIPGPKPLPLIGNTWRFLPKIGDLYGLQPHEMYYRFYEQYGDIVCIRGILNQKAAVLLFNPEEIAKVYRNEGQWPIRDPVNCVKYFRKVVRKDFFEGVGGLASENGEEWFKLRSLVNPILMQPRAVKKYIDKIDETAAELVDNMKYFAKNNSKQEMPENFLNEIYKYTLESIGIISMDKRFGCLNRSEKMNPETQNLITFTNESFDLMFKLDFGSASLYRWYSTPDWKRFVYITNYIVDTFKRYIDEEAERIKQRASSNNEEASVFQQLVKINSKVAVIMTLDMLMAGIDTTGRVIGAGLYYLATNKESQNKLRKELLKLLPSKDSPITNEVLDQAHYLKAVVKEVNRLATIAIGNLRTTVKDTVLSGYQIPEGTNVFTGHLIISTRTDKYFPKADMFIPERWLRSNNSEISNKNVNPFVSQPFGFGPRSCIGKRFAVMEIEVALAKIIRNFELDWHYPDMEFETVLLYGIANPLKVQAKEISQ